MSDWQPVPGYVVEWRQVPGLAHVEYGTGPWQRDQYFIYFHCQRCGDISQKPCLSPQRLNYWVLTYAQQHAHGFMPSVR